LEIHERSNVIPSAYPIPARQNSAESKVQLMGLPEREGQFHRCHQRGAGAGTSGLNLPKVLGAIGV